MLDIHRAAAADEPARAVEVQFEVTGDAAGCLESRRVEESVQRRSTRIHFVGESSRRVSVTARAPGSARGAEAWRAEIRVAGAADAADTRSLSGQDCNALTDAVGFIIAVAFDPPAAVSNPATDSEPTQTTIKPVPAQNIAPERNQQTVNAAPSFESMDPVDAPDMPGFSAPHVVTRLSLGGEFTTQVGPRALLGVGLGLGFELPADRGISFSPAARLHAAYFPENNVSRGAGKAHFSLVAGRLTLCPLALGYSRVALRLCAQGVGGALQASGFETQQPEHHARPWGALGGVLVWDVSLSRAVSLEAEAGMAGTLVRDAFQFEPEVFYRTGPMVTRGSLVLSLVLP